MTWRSLERLRSLKASRMIVGKSRESSRTTGKDYCIGSIVSSHSACFGDVVGTKCVVSRACPRGFSMNPPRNALWEEPPRNARIALLNPRMQKTFHAHVSSCGLFITYGRWMTRRWMTQGIEINARTVAAVRVSQGPILRHLGLAEVHLFHSDNTCAPNGLRHHNPYVSIYSSIALSACESGAVLCTSRTRGGRS